jgi:hypothetical protein
MITKVKIIAAILDGSILFAIAGALLAFPQRFTKKDLKLEENKSLGSKLKKIGWFVVVVGVLKVLLDIADMFVRK